MRLFLETCKYTRLCLLISGDRLMVDERALIAISWALVYVGVAP